MRDAGHNVTIFEASSRVGGRIQTYRDLGNGWQAELGAMRVPKQHRFTLEGSKKYNLTLADFNNDPFRRYMHDDNLDASPDPKELKFFIDQFNVHPKDKKLKYAKIIQKALQKPLKDFHRLSWSQLKAKYDKYSFRQWLSQKARLSPDTIDYVSIFYNIENFLDSALIGQVSH